MPVEKEVAASLSTLSGASETSPQTPSEAGLNGSPRDPPFMMIRIGPKEYLNPELGGLLSGSSYRFGMKLLRREFGGGSTSAVLLSLKVYYVPCCGLRLSGMVCNKP